MGTPADRPVAPARARVGLSTASVYPGTCATAFELASRLGYDGIEVMVWTDVVSQEAGALRALPAGTDVVIVTDSQLLMNSMTIWIEGWRRKGWKTAGNKPVKNRDLVEALDEEIQRHNVRWHWVRGHTGDPGNERADARSAASRP